MLLIAQPKSASTSLLKTLAKIIGVKAANGFGKKGKWELCEGFTELQKYHDTTIKRKKPFLNFWLSHKTALLKEHILPTEHHKKIIKESNKHVVILLRNPTTCYHNYVRMIDDFKQGRLPDKVIKELMPWRFFKIDQFQFYQDIKDFNAGWQGFDYDKKLIVTFEQLILKYKQTMRKILKHYGHGKKRITPLLKAKGNHGYSTYTGNGERKLKTC
jgi:hypothetical protein